MPDGPTDAEIGQNVKAFRLAAGLSQTELAEAMTKRGWPLHQQTVLRIEKGVRPLKLAEASDMADVLGVSIKKLTERPVRVEIDHVMLRIAEAWKAIMDQTVAYLEARSELAQLLEQDPDPLIPDQPFLLAPDAPEDAVATGRWAGRNVTIDFENLRQRARGGERGVDPETS